MMASSEIIVLLKNNLPIIQFLMMKKIKYMIVWDVQVAVGNV